MATEKIEKVLANMQQGLSTDEQQQARENIGIGEIPSLTMTTEGPEETVVSDFHHLDFNLDDFSVKADTTTVGILAPRMTPTEKRVLTLDANSPRPGWEIAPIVPEVTRYAGGSSSGAIYSNVDFRLGSSNQILSKASNDSDYVLHGFDAPVTTSQSDSGKYLKVTVDGSGNQTVTWDNPAGQSYSAGTGINISSGNEISWAYTVGRNLHINQNNAIQTNLPGGAFEAPTQADNNFHRISDAKFAGAYVLACKHTTSDTYELAIAYKASGLSGSYQFLGTETVIGTDNSVTTKRMS